ncbi:MAG: hypothetical protein HY695_06415 [Deltaproteobacteria bacterium]|nr:hypothetical protein [Deltaproteobacteria bacterium]
MALKLVRGIPKDPEQGKQQKSREEYLVACLREEVNDSRFTAWEKEFILSLDRQVGQGRQLTGKQKQILERIWEK